MPSRRSTTPACCRVPSPRPMTTPSPRATSSAPIPPPMPRSDPVPRWPTSSRSVPSSVAVPDLVDLAEADAITALDDAGLLPGAVTEAYDDTIVAGHVISSDPAADAEVGPGSAVAYVLSLGPEQVAVPDLVDLAEADAITALDDAGLLPGAVTEAYDDTIAAGHVISSDPAADAEVGPGSAVAYVLSLGPEHGGRARPRRPGRGRCHHGARRRRPAAGCRHRGLRRHHRRRPRHQLRSRRRCRASALGSAVAYVLSLAVPSSVAVPDLVDLAAGRCHQQALDDAGLAAGVPPARPMTTPSPPATSSAHDPAAGTERRPSVPTVGLRPLAAVPSHGDRARLSSGAAADAEPGARRCPTHPGYARVEAYDDTIAAGDVVSQDPAAGTSVAVGSTVSYVVSQGPEQVTVPDLRGRRRCRAGARRCPTRGQPERGL